jgi:hypothetical protein
MHCRRREREAKLKKVTILLRAHRHLGLGGTKKDPVATQIATLEALAKQRTVQANRRTCWAGNDHSDHIFSNRYRLLK